MHIFYSAVIVSESNRLKKRRKAKFHQRVFLGLVISVSLSPAGGDPSFFFGWENCMWKMWIKNTKIHCKYSGCDRNGFLSGQTVWRSDFCLSGCSLCSCVLLPFPEWKPQMNGILKMNHRTISTFPSFGCGFLSWRFTILSVSTFYIAFLSNQAVQKRMRNK